MAFFRKNKKRKSQPQELVPVRQTQRQTRKVVPVEVKLLAAEAFAAGLSAKEVSEIIGTAPTAINNWVKIYREGGAEALLRKNRPIRILVEQALIHEALDPNVARTSLIDGVQNGTHRYTAQTQANGGS